MALRVFGDRHDGSIVPRLQQLATESKGSFALHALWALNLSGGLNEPTATKLLVHAEPSVRAWTVRLLGDQKRVGPRIAPLLANLARAETEVMVRSQLASSTRRLPTSECLPIVRNLLDHDEDQADIHVPLLVWWALESKCGTDREAVLEILRDRDVWSKKLVRETILNRLMKRFALAGSQKDLHACIELLRLAPDKEHGLILLKGFEEAFKGAPSSGCRRRCSKRSPSSAAVPSRSASASVGPRPSRKRWPWCKIPRRPRRNAKS